jgi:hypothetical protein
MIIPAGERTNEKEMELAIITYLMTCPYGFANYKGGADGGLFFNLRRYASIRAARAVAGSKGGTVSAINRWKRR